MPSLARRHLPSRVGAVTARWALALVVSATAVAATACSANPPPPTHGLSGLVSARAVAGTLAACAAPTGVSAGESVVVRNARGTEIGRTTLEPFRQLDSGGCGYPFFVARVPDTTFYSLEIGPHHLPTVARRDLIAQGWSILIRWPPPGGG